MKQLYFLLTPAIWFSLHVESSEKLDVVPSVLTRKKCLELRKDLKVPNKEVIFCILRAMTNNVLKEFYPVENKCDEKLNIASSGKTCYSVRAWNNETSPKAKEHEYTQSFSKSLYYSSETNRDLENEGKMESVELTLEKPLKCHSVYKPIKRLSHGRGSGSSYHFNEINLDTHTGGKGVLGSIGYKTPLSGVIGGIEVEATGEYIGSESTGNGNGKNIILKVPKGATCAPQLFQTALVCKRQAGKLKIIYKDGATEEKQLRDVTKGFLLMPLKDSKPDPYISVLACVGHR